MESSSFSTVSCLMARLALIADSFYGLSSIIEYVSLTGLKFKNSILFSLMHILVFSVGGQLKASSVVVIAAHSF